MEGMSTPQVTVDLGTHTLRIATRGNLDTIDQEALVVSTYSGKREKVIAVGNSALDFSVASLKMRRRRPYSFGTFTDTLALGILFSAFLPGKRKLLPFDFSKMYINMYATATDVERQMLRSFLRTLGFEPIVVPNPIANALGAGWSLEKTKPFVVLEIGVGVIEVAVLSYGVVLQAVRFPFFGSELYERKKLHPERLAQLGAFFIDFLETLGSSVHAAAIEQGVLLTGVAPMLQEIAVFLSDQAALPVFVLPDGTHTCIRGLNVCAEQAYEKMF